MGISTMTTTTSTIIATNTLILIQTSMETVAAPKRKQLSAKVKEPLTIHVVIQVIQLKRKLIFNKYLCKMAFSLVISPSKR